MSDLDQWRDQARAWLRAQPPPRTDPDQEPVQPGAVAVFDNLSFEEEAEQLAAAARWQRAKLAAGYGAITWPREYGGAGLTAAHEEAFSREEAQVATPRKNELVRQLDADLGGGQ
jgi:alkylation response protein AidB-like acyl-CoA dehydrogenase